ncbi:hypothetical protein Hanom_Chr10g00944921 [Helianthus anomalus]
MCELLLTLAVVWSNIRVSWMSSNVTQCKVAEVKLPFWLYNFKFSENQRRWKGMK